MLSKSLRHKIQTYIKGREIIQISFIEKFGIDFISEVIHSFNQITFVIDDFIFIENDKAEFFYQIINGKVGML